MPHPNRRNDDPDDGRKHLILDVVESTSAKAVARLLLPLLLGLTVWIASTALERIDEQGRDLAQVKSDVRVMTARLDDAVIKQVTTNTQNIDEHEHRLQVLERKVQVQ